MDAPNYAALVADDSPEIRRVMDYGLRRRGFVVWLACDGAEAVELFAVHAETIDVVLLDICMPNLDGIEALATLRTMKPRRPCCLMSGDLGSYTDQTVLDAGAQRFFAKPFRLDEVCDALVDLAYGTRALRSADVRRAF